MRLPAILLSVLLAVLPVVSAAQTVPGGVLVVDQERLFTDSAFGKRAARVLELHSQALAAENRQIEGQLRAEEEQLTKDRETLSAEEFRARADAFDQKTQRIRDEQAKKFDDLRTAQEAERTTFFNKAVPVLTGIVRDRGASVLMDRRAVLISADAVDITDIAIERIDAAVGDGVAKP